MRRTVAWSSDNVRVPGLVCIRDSARVVDGVHESIDSRSNALTLQPAHGSRPGVRSFLIRLAARAVTARGRAS